MRYRILLTAIAITTLVIATVIPGFAAPGEDSVYDWWSQQPNPQNRPLTLVRETEDGKYHGTSTYAGTWTNGDAMSDLKVEWAGWENVNRFGWYGWWDDGSTPIYSNWDDEATTDLTSDPLLDATPYGNRWKDVTITDPNNSSNTLGTFGLYQIFAGGDAAGASFNTFFNGWFNQAPDGSGANGKAHPHRWGFWLSTNDSDDYGNQVWLTQWAWNQGYDPSTSGSVTTYPSGGDGPDYAKDPDKTGVFCEVFQDTKMPFGRGWVLAWEDRDDPTAFSGNYYPATSYEFEDNTANNPDYDFHGEADFNDMILRFGMVDETTGELPEVPEPGTWVLLLATGAFGSWLKRRRES